MELKDLPVFLLKPLPRSRVRGHVQTLAMINLRTDSGFEVEIAICENVCATRRRSATGAREWNKWSDTKYDDHAAARVAFVDETAKWINRKYFSIVDSGLLLPLNETDVRHLRNDGMLPRAMLEYGSELFSAIAQWRQTEIEKLAPPVPASAPAAGTPPPPPPVPPVPPVPPRSGRRGSSLPTSTPDLDDVLGKLRSRASSVGS